MLCELSPQTPLYAYGYTPREQEVGQAVLSSDLYALASTAYFLATGKPPPSPMDRQRRDISFPNAVWGRYTALDDLYTHEKFLTSWLLDPDERCFSAAVFLERHKPPETRRRGPSKRLGEFTCGDWVLELNDDDYVARRRDDHGG